MVESVQTEGVGDGVWERVMVVVPDKDRVM